MDREGGEEQIRLAMTESLMSFRHITLQNVVWGKDLTTPQNAMSFDTWLVHHMHRERLKVQSLRCPHLGHKQQEIVHH